MLSGVLSRLQHSSADCLAAGRSEKPQYRAISPRDALLYQQFSKCSGLFLAAAVGVYALKSQREVGQVIATYPVWAPAPLLHEGFERSSELGCVAMAGALCGFFAVLSVFSAR